MWRSSQSISVKLVETDFGNESKNSTPLNLNSPEMQARLKPTTENPNENCQKVFNEIITQLSEEIHNSLKTGEIKMKY